MVPELASRDHVRKLLPMLRELMQATGEAAEMNGVAYTSGPGLIGALMVGCCVGRSLAFGWGVPAIGVHHMEGHLLAPLLEIRPSFPLWRCSSPADTMLVAVQDIGEYEILGDPSMTPRAGLRQVAKMLDLDYPGGPG